MYGPRVFDTNVLRGANLDDQSDQLTLACKISCINALIGALAGDNVVVLDGSAEHGSEILDEYRRNIAYQGGGAGNRFLRWLLNKFADDLVCRLVPITPLPGRSYEEFPTRSDLATFDPSDRKWVAVAISHFRYFDVPAPIFQAADHKWRAFVSACAEENVIIDFLCDAR